MNKNKYGRNGLLNRKDEAIPEIAEIMRVRPDFNDNASYIMGLYLKEEYMLAHKMHGLRKAGMAL